MLGGKPFHKYVESSKEKYINQPCFNRRSKHGRTQFTKTDGNLGMPMQCW